MSGGASDALNKLNPWIKKATGDLFLFFFSVFFRAAAAFLFVIVFPLSRSVVAHLISSFLIFILSPWELSAQPHTHTHTNVHTRPYISTEWPCQIPRQWSRKYSDCVPDVPWPGRSAQGSIFTDDMLPVITSSTVCQSRQAAEHWKLSNSHPSGHKSLILGGTYRWPVGDRRPNLTGDSSRVYAE